jgi:AcrR family transcriptional regulator
MRWGKKIIKHRHLFSFPQSIFFETERYQVMFMKNHFGKSEKYKKIVEVSSELMSEKGYKGASLDQIADIVGIHKSTLFHYFKSKEQLLMAVLEISTEEVIRDLEAIIKSKNFSPEEKLRLGIVNHLQSQLKYYDSVNVYHSEIRFLSGRNKQKFLKRREHYGLCFVRLIEQIIKSNTKKFAHFRELDSRIVAFGILGMCNWAAKWFRESGPLKSKDVADIFYSMLIQHGHGTRNKPGSPSEQPGDRLMVRAGRR